METNIRIENNAGACHIDIEGTIGVPETWQFDEPEQRIATYDRFREAVARIGEIEAPEVVNAQGVVELELGGDAANPPVVSGLL